MAIKFNKKQKLIFKLLAGINVLVLTITCLFIETVRADLKNDLGNFKNQIGTSIKSAAVSGLGQILPDQAKTLASTNITQTVYNAPENFANSLKTTVVSGLGQILPDQAKTLASTNITQTIYNAPENFANSFKSAAVNGLGYFTNLSQTFLGSLSTKYNFINEAVKNVIGINTRTASSTNRYNSESRFTSILNENGEQIIVADENEVSGHNYPKHKENKVSFPGLPEKNTLINKFMTNFFSITSKHKLYEL